MSDSEKSSELANNAKKTILLQLGISLAIAAGFLLKDGSWVAISAFYKIQHRSRGKSRKSCRVSI